MLKSSNSPHIACIVVLTVVVMVANVEMLVPGVSSIVLGGTPVPSGGKSANCGSLREHLVQFVLRWQKPIAVSVKNQIVANPRSNASFAAPVHNSRGIDLSCANGRGGNPDGDPPTTPLRPCALVAGGRNQPMLPSAIQAG